MDGIRETATCLQMGKIKISPSMKNWNNEIQGYVWDDNLSDDSPVKVNDHLMDAMRYFCKTMHIVNTKKRYKPVIYKEE